MKKETSPRSHLVPQVSNWDCFPKLRSRAEGGVPVVCGRTCRWAVCSYPLACSGGLRAGRAVPGSPSVVLERTAGEILSFLLPYRITVLETRAENSSLSSSFGDFCKSPRTAWKTSPSERVLCTAVPEQGKSRTVSVAPVRKCRLKPCTGTVSS